MEVKGGKGGEKGRRWVTYCGVGGSKTPRKLRECGFPDNRAVHGGKEWNKRKKEKKNTEK